MANGLTLETGGHSYEKHLEESRNRRDDLVPVG